MAGKRRGRGEDAVYFAHRTGTECKDEKNHKGCTGRWRGEIDLGRDGTGKRVRPKVSGRTKTIVKDKLDALHNELDSGIKTSATYLVEQAVEDWLDEGLDGRAAKTVTTNREVLAPLVALIGKRKLRELAAPQLRTALLKLAVTRSTRTLQLTHAGIVRVITHAQANGKVGQNVASLIRPPKGQDGRPSKTLTVAQAVALIEAAKNTRLYAYIVLSMLVGIRTEEARALRWDHVDLEGLPDADPPVPPSVSVWRSVRLGGDTKTPKSRRTLKLPQIAVVALKDEKEMQAAAAYLAGDLWEDTGLVFCSSVGTPLDAHNVRREFRKICKAAGLDPEAWAPRELRHTFVSILSDHGVSVEAIADLVGHSTTSTTEVVYRHSLRPVLQAGADVMDVIFKPTAG